MEDLQQALQRILSDPGQMAQLQAMASALGMTGQDPVPSSAPETEPSGSPGERDAAENRAPELSALPELLGQLSRIHGPEERVLAALRPVLEPEKQGKIDKALQAARISRLAGQFLLNREGRDV